MLIKTITIITFVAIVYSLGSALYHLVKHRDNQDSEKTYRALTLRIGLSMALFVLLFIAFATGLLRPQGIGARMQQGHSPNSNAQQP